MFLSCATSNLSQEGKHFTVLKGPKNISLISCGVRAAPYLHCHSDAAALAVPDGLHAAPHLRVRAQNPFIAALVKTTSPARSKCPGQPWGSASLTALQEGTEWWWQGVL